jgi:hypothetical protein
MKELDLIEKKELRDGFIDRMEVLDKVGELILLSNTEYATIEQVSSYYGIPKETVETVIMRNKEELESDGYKTFPKSNVISFLNIPNECLTSKVGKSIVSLPDGNILELPNRGLRLFPKRAILRVGMLLRDSEVAKEIRTRLLDIVQDVEQGKTDIIDNVMNEITEEKQIMMERMEAELAGDFDAVCVANAKLFALKNKRIAKLEIENDFIKTTALTIIESKSVINRIVKKIATLNYRGQFSSAWGDFYSKVNYKLHINANNRKGSGLKRFTDEEIVQMEKISRSWAAEVGLDLEKLLKLASKH